MDFIHIWHDGRYRSEVFISTIPTPGVTLGSRSWTSNFHKKVRVKVFALKFIRSHILETLWWISFILSMMVDIGLKFLSAPSPLQGWSWGQGHGPNFHKKVRVKIFALKFIRPHILKTLWWISFIFGMMVDIALKFLLAPSPSWGWPLERSTIDLCPKTAPWNVSLKYHGTWRSTVTVWQLWIVPAQIWL